MSVEPPFPNSAHMFVEYCLPLDSKVFLENVDDLFLALIHYKKNDAKEIAAPAALAARECGLPCPTTVKSQESTRKDRRLNSLKPEDFDGEHRTLVEDLFDYFDRIYLYEEYDDEETGHARDIHLNIDNYSHTGWYLIHTAFDLAIKSLIGNSERAKKFSIAWETCKYETGELAGRWGPIRGVRLRYNPVSVSNENARYGAGMPDMGTDLPGMGFSLRSILGFCCMNVHMKEDYSEFSVNAISADEEEAAYSMMMTILKKFNTFLKPTAPAKTRLIVFNGENLRYQHIEV